MFKFLRESIKEFDHVVWPTRAETKKYLSIVISIIVVLTIILFILGSAFTTSLFALRDAIVPPSISQSTSSTKTPIDLGNIVLNSGATASGASLSGVSVSGVTLPTASWAHSLSGTSR